MHIKHMHEMIEKLTDCTKSAIENDQVSVGQYPISDVVDMIKDLNEASYYASIVKAMEEAKKEDEEEEKYMLRMLKDEHKDEYKRMREEYGEEEADRRFYDAWRYKSSGRYAPKGKGTRYGRRGYKEPMYFLPPEVYMNYSPEELRDMDRDMGRMYYGGGSPGGNSGGGQSSGSGMSGGSSGGNSGGNVRGYEDGYNDGNRKGYSEGYEQGNRDGRSQGGNSRYENARRSYSESKQKNRGSTPEENSENMKKLEEVLNTVKDNIQEYVPMMSTSEKAMAKQKIDGICKMIQQ